VGLNQPLINWWLIEARLKKEGAQTDSKERKGFMGGKNWLGAVVALILLVAAFVGYLFMLFYFGIDLVDFGRPEFQLDFGKIGFYFLYSLSTLVAVVLLYSIFSKIAVGSEEKPGFLIRLFNFFWLPKEDRLIYRAQEGEILFHRQLPSKVATVDFVMNWQFLPVSILLGLFISFALWFLPLPLNIGANLFLVFCLVLIAVVKYSLLEWERRTTIFTIFTHNSILLKIRKSLSGLMPVIKPLIFMAFLLIVGIFNLWIFGSIILVLAILLLPETTRAFLKHLFFSGGHSGLPVTSLTVNSGIQDVLTAADPEDVTVDLDPEVKNRFKTGWLKEFFLSLWYRKYGTGALLIIYINKSGTDFLPYMDDVSRLKEILFRARDESRRLQAEQQQQEGQQGPVFSLLTGRVLSSSSTSSSSNEVDESQGPSGSVIYVGSDQE